MDDRFTPALWLEMTRRSPADYEAERVPEVLALPGVERATWWKNVQVGRDDLPRVLPEFDLLGVYEVSEDFRAPPTPDVLDGLHFRRTHRPGQGCLSANPTIGLMLVLISPTEPQFAQALRDWCDFVHLRAIAQAGVPGFTMITPYENVVGGDPLYLHLYELDVDDPGLATKALGPCVEERVGREGTPEYAAWSWHDALRVEYINNFKRVGERDA